VRQKPDDHDADFDGDAVHGGGLGRSVWRCLGKRLRKASGRGGGLFDRTSARRANRAVFLVRSLQENDRLGE
jgi:hypothetical protein